MLLYSRPCSDHCQKSCNLASKGPIICSNDLEKGDQSLWAVNDYKVMAASGDMHTLLKAIACPLQNIFGVSIQLISPASGDFETVAARSLFIRRVSIQLISPASGDSITQSFARQATALSRTKLHPQKWRFSFQGSERLLQSLCERL